ncbi:MAG: glycerophosphodiester phosphodiesterase [Clostridiales bacterium]|nr:glycerophosphodiester phosphodiesterase [Clostridiales bacterium]
MRNAQTGKRFSFKLAALIAAIALVAAASGISVFAAVRYARLYSSELPAGFTATAHTGCVGTKDNSLESIRSGAECGADIVEFDLRFLKSGVPVLAHDDNFSDDAVTLREAFACAQKYTDLRFNVDLKDKNPNFLGGAVGIIEEFFGFPTDRVFFTGIESDDPCTEILRANAIAFYLNPDIKYSERNSESVLNREISRALQMGAVGINMKHTLSTRKSVEKFHNAGLKVSVFTPNSQWSMARLIPLGVDNITTKRPDRLAEIIERQRKS